MKPGLNNGQGGSGIPMPGTEAPATTDHLLGLISRQKFFDGLTPHQLQLLADSAILMQFQPGEWLFLEGDLANRFYIILEGQVELEADTEDCGRIAIEELGPGDDLGWSWLFPPCHFHFSARAITSTRAICFYGIRLRRQCEEDTAFGYAMLKRVAQVTINRLQATRRKLVKLSAEHETSL